MGIKAAFQSLVKKWNFRFKTLPTRFNELQSQFESLLLEVHASNTLKLEQLNDHKYETLVIKIRKVEYELACYIATTDHVIEREVKNRLAQAKRANDKFKSVNKDYLERFEEIKKSFRTTNQNFDEARSQFRNIRKEIDLLNPFIHQAKSDLENLQAIADYHQSLFDNNQGMIIGDRSHGSGENTSGSIRKN